MISIKYRNWNCTPLMVKREFIRGTCSLVPMYGGAHSRPHTRWTAAIAIGPIEGGIVFQAPYPLGLAKGQGGSEFSDGLSGGKKGWVW